MSDISVIILSHNRLPDLKRNLERLLAERQRPDEFQFIVVDNDSADGSKEFLTTLASQDGSIEVVQNNRNLGVGAGRNVGFAKAVRPFIVSLDDDSTIGAEDLRLVPALFGSLPDTGLLAFRVVHAVTGKQQNLHGDQPCLVANHHGAGFAFRRVLYKQLGGIDEECNYGAEELDFAIRVCASRMRVRYTPEITVRHNSFPRDAAEEQWRLERRVYNNLRVYHKYFPLWMATRNSCRYLVAALWAWARQFGCVRLGCLVRAAIDGRRAGRRLHRAVPADTVRYYDNWRLRPEFGNVPLSIKLWRKAWGALAARCARRPGPTSNG